MTTSGDYNKGKTKIKWELEVQVTAWYKSGTRVFTFLHGSYHTMSYSLVLYAFLRTLWTFKGKRNIVHVCFKFTLFKKIIPHIQLKCLLQRKLNICCRLSKLIYASLIKRGSHSQSKASTAGWLSLTLTNPADFPSSDVIYLPLHPKQPSTRKPRISLIMPKMSSFLLTLFALLGSRRGALLAQLGGTCRPGVPGWGRR